MRYKVSKLLNTWVVRDTDLLKKHQRSVVAEFQTEEEANDFCGKLNALPAHEQQS